MSKFIFLPYIKDCRFSCLPDITSLDPKAREELSYFILRFIHTICLDGRTHSIWSVSLLCLFYIQSRIKHSSWMQPKIFWLYLKKHLGSYKFDHIWVYTWDNNKFSFNKSLYASDIFSISEVNYHWIKRFQNSLLPVV